MPVANLTISRARFAKVFQLIESWSGQTTTGVARGVALAGLGEVLLALREDPLAAAATRGFGFLNIGVPDESDLSGCADHIRRAQGSSPPR